jgi:Reverse transcriptase (RNA-dependent DNA polymerase)
MRPYTEEPGAEQFACPVLDWRRMERSIRRPYGKQRPLGVTTWSDKLVAEAVRLILDAYFDGQFSEHSHGFREGRGCADALRDIYHNWKGCAWIIEGDISDGFGSLSHDLLISVLSEKIHDGRFIRLMKQLLDAGYLEDWKFNRTLRESRKVRWFHPCFPTSCSTNWITLSKPCSFPAPPQGRKEEKTQCISQSCTRLNTASSEA